MTVGTPDEEWGQAVSLAVVPTAGATPTVREVRDQLRETLPGHALPRRLLVLDALPTRGPGKPDHAAIAASTQWQNL